MVIDIFMGDGRIRESKKPIIIRPSKIPGGPSEVRLREDAFVNDFNQGRRRSFHGKMASERDRERFRRAIDLYKDSGAILTTHDVPDGDGLGAAYAIKRFLQSKYPSCRADIVVSQQIPHTDRLIEALGIDVCGWDRIPPQDDRPIIVLDTNSLALLTGARILGNRIHMIIDHHQKDVGREDSSSPDADVEIINIKAISACEILASIIPKDEIDERMALALASGIICDSERLKLADDQSLVIFQRLRKASGWRRDRIEEVAFPAPSSQTVSVLIDEMKMVRKSILHERLVAIGRTQIEPAAILSSALRDIGASVVGVLGEISPSLHKLSLRVNVRDAHENDLRADEIARKIGRICGVPENKKPGGHIDKAGGILPGSFEELSEIIFENIKEEMDRVFGKSIR